jgi:hypothetical protein
MPGSRISVIGTALWFLFLGMPSASAAEPSDMVVEWGSLGSVTTSWFDFYRMTCTEYLVLQGRASMNGGPTPIGMPEAGRDRVISYCLAHPFGDEAEARVEPPRFGSILQGKVISVPLALGGWPILRQPTAH